MSEPPRLHEVGSADERALVRAAAAYTPPAESRERLLEALGVAVAAASTGALLGASSTAQASGAPASAAGGAVSSSAVAGSLLKPALLKGGVLGAKVWLAVAATVAVTSAGTAMLVRTAPPSGSPRDEAERALAEPHGERRLSPAPHEADPSAAVAERPGATPHPAPLPPGVVTEEAAPTAPQPPTKPAARARPGATLEAELTSLDRARLSLRSGAHHEALRLLRAHHARFPAGSLALEAEALYVQALAAAGERRAAETRARAFVRAHPDSLLAHRLRELALIPEPPLVPSPGPRSPE